MQLITNNESQTHLSVIKSAFDTAEQVFIAVAFLKQSGLNELLPSIKKCLRRSCTVTVVCGLDFALTEPTALHQLRKLFEGTSSKLKLFSSAERNTIFHPKFFLFENVKYATVIIGSANLTRGGLVGNEECSLQVNTETTSEFFGQAKQYMMRLADLAEQATLLRVLQYESFYNEQAGARNAAKAKPDARPTLFNYDNLHEWLRLYEEEKDREGIYRDKLMDYRNARGLLDEIAEIPNISREAFIPLFEQLVGGAGIKRSWHSGSIYRKKTFVFDHAHQFQEVVRFVRQNRNQPAGIVFEQANVLVSLVGGSGVNTVTEIMMTYQPSLFANLNTNPITVLRNEGDVLLPAHRNSFHGPQYELYCDLIREICQQLGLRDMLEADSLFNFIYWKIYEA